MDWGELTSRIVNDTLQLTIGTHWPRPSVVNCKDSAGLVLLIESSGPPWMPT